MLDVRYHIFYLGLMFLMLGFGIFIGASIIGPAQVRQQAGAIANLRLTSTKVAQDRDAARGRFTKDEAALAALQPALVRGKLSGKRIVVIQTGDYADAAESANKAVTDAGATVAASVVLTDRWGALAPRQRAALSGLAPVSDPAAQDKALLAALAAALTAGAEGDSVLESLQGQNLITKSGDLSQPCTFFVLVGGKSDDTPSPALDGLLDGFGEVTSNVTLVGCEPSGAAVSSVPSFQNAGIATVDCIDLPLGQLALPFALRGEKSDYGLKATAKQPLPDSLAGAVSP